MLRKSKKRMAWYLGITFILKPTTRQNHASPIFPHNRTVLSQNRILYLHKSCNSVPRAKLLRLDKSTKLQTVPHPALCRGTRSSRASASRESFKSRTQAQRRSRDNLLAWLSLRLGRPSCAKLRGVHSCWWARISSQGGNCGLPQGSPVLPILFMLFFSPLFKLKALRKGSGYADDVAVTESSLSLVVNIGGWWCIWLYTLGIFN